MISENKRIDELIKVVMQVAQGDYSVQAMLSEQNDEIDALSMGLNMMIDDLKNNVDLEAQNQRFKEINKQLQAAKEKAQESDRLKSAFLSNMSHEIRSPLNAIIGFSALLGRGNISPEKSAQFSIYIQDAGRQLLTLINDIIDISKIESNQLKLHIKPYNVKEMLQQAFEIVSQDQKLRLKPNLRLVLKINQSDNYFVLTDQVRFKQIFINLLNNAIKFTDTGFVELGYSTNVQQNTITICVKDSGTGIPGDFLEVIFDRFRQVHTDQFQSGTGLGLSITKGLVELLGGKIEVQSNLGFGSEFRVSFPLLENQEKPVAGNINVAHRKQLDLSKYTIYIAEDRLDSFLFLEEVLLPYKAKLVHAKNGQELIDLITEKIPDLVLLDMHMPVKNGYEAIKEIREKNYNFPVIAQTAYAMADEQAGILNSGCDGYLAKPIDPDEFIKEVVKHLRIT